jgi:hypothetical protein
MARRVHCGGACGRVVMGQGQCACGVGGHPGFVALPMAPHGHGQISINAPGPEGVQCMHAALAGSGCRCARHAPRRYSYPWTCLRRCPRRRRASLSTCSGKSASGRHRQAKKGGLRCAGAHNIQAEHNTRAQQPPRPRARLGTPQAFNVCPPLAGAHVASAAVRSSVR